jgi:hypothetical protein
MQLPSTMTPIATNTLTTTATSVTFSNLPQGYTDLVLIFNGSNVTSNNGMRLRFNSDTGSNYSETYIYGNGTSAISTRGTSQTSVQVGGDVGSTQSTVVVSIQNYSNTTTNKTTLGRGSSAGTLVDATVGLWRNTAAITSIEFRLGAGTSNFASGSTFTIYGVKAA